MTYYYDISEVAEQGRAAAHEAKEGFRRLKNRPDYLTVGALDAIERELKIATAICAHLRERVADNPVAKEPEMTPAEFVREFGGSVS